MLAYQLGDHGLESRQMLSFFSSSFINFNRGSLIRFYKAVIIYTHVEKAKNCISRRGAYGEAG